jgi:hypothetical protein
MDSLWILAPLFLIASFLYSTVGHGGASAYLAIGALVGLSRAEMVPIALSLNVLVTSLGLWHYGRAGFFQLRLLLPFVLTSIPMAFIGGSLELSPQVFSALLGVTLLIAALRLLGLGRAMRPREVESRWLWPVGLLLGALLGFLAGLIGVGGGIFLSPLLLFLGWANVKRTAAVSAAFIWVNSLSGLFAHALRGTSDWDLLLPLLAVVAVGGGLGSRLGALRFSPVLIQRLLGAVLLVASLKLLLQAIAE